MIIAKIQVDNSYYSIIKQKLMQVSRKYPIHIDIIRRGDTIYLFSLDDGFSTAFLYRAYLKAKERGLQTSILYARYIDENWIPEEIRKAAEKLVSEKLNSKEVETLKRFSVTEHMLRRWSP